MQMLLVMIKMSSKLTLSPLSPPFYMIILVMMIVMMIVMMVIMMLLMMIKMFTKLTLSSASFLFYDYLGDDDCACVSAHVGDNQSSVRVFFAFLCFSFLFFFLQKLCEHVDVLL